MYFTWTLYIILALNSISAVLAVVCFIKIFKVAKLTKTRKYFFVLAFLLFLTLAVVLESALVALKAQELAGYKHMKKGAYLVSFLYSSPYMIFYPLSYLFLLLAFIEKEKEKNTIWSTVFLVPCEVSSTILLLLILFEAFRNKASDLIKVSIVMLLLSHLSLLLPCIRGLFSASLVRSIALLLFLAECLR